MRGEKTKYLPLLLSLLMVFSMTFAVYAPVTLPLVAVDPATTAVNPGGSFTISVIIQGVTDLFSYEVKLGYDNDILAVAAVAEGPFIKDQTTSPMGTFFSSIVDPNYVYGVCVTLGSYPGVSGSGTLFTVTFDVIDAGAVNLDLYDSILLDSNGTTMAHELAAGYFETPARANLLRRSAWPEHHHFVVSKDEDGVQTLNAKAKNLGPIDILIRVTFDIMRDDSFLTSATSDEVLVTPGVIVELAADFGPLAPTDAGKYYVSARAYYSWSGTNWFPGEKVKTFSFAVVP